MKKAKHGKFIIGGIALLVVLLVMSLVGFCFDYYFDLNDDCLMKDILSGAYTGSPASRNIQMLYPISFLISVFYKIFNNADVYGIFLCAFQYAAILLFVIAVGTVIYRIRYSEMHTIDRDRSDNQFLVLKKIYEPNYDLPFPLVVAVIVLIVVNLAHFVFVQYTYSVALMAGAICTTLYVERFGITRDVIREGKIKIRFSKLQIISLICLFLCFVVRRNMALLMLPFICLSIFFNFVDSVHDEKMRELKEYEFYSRGFRRDGHGFYFGNTKPQKEELDTYKKICRNRRNFELKYVKYVLINRCSFMILAAFTIILALIINAAAYSPSKWSDFMDFFDARTNLYDYQTIPSYEGNEEFYESIGLDEAEVTLIHNYNFGLDEDIDTDTLNKITEYAKTLDNESFLYKVKSAFSSYIYRMVHVWFQEGYEYPQTDAPWNLIILALYILAMSIDKFKLRTVWKAGVLFFIRTGLWMYILVGGRDPIRVTHGLYFAEACVLVGMACVSLMILHEEEKGIKTYSNEEAKKIERRRHISIEFMYVSIVVLAAIVPFYAYNIVTVINEESANRQETNSVYSELMDYMDENEDKFFFLDVYSTVSYSEKMFGDVDNSLANYDILGGWASKSPIEEEKLEKYGISNIMDGLLKENVFFVIKSDSDTNWLVDYYACKGYDIETEVVDSVADSFDIIDVSVN